MMGAPNKEVDLQSLFEQRYNALRPWHMLWRCYGLVAIVAMMFTVAIMLFSTQSGRELEPYPEPLFGICIAIFIVCTCLYLYSASIVWQITNTKYLLLLKQVEMSSTGYNHYVHVWENSADSMEIEFRYAAGAYKFNCNTRMFAKELIDVVRKDEWYDWVPTFSQAIESGYQ